MATRNYLAIDLGAASGRVMLGRFDGERIELSELHRFPNEPVRLPESLCWDAPRLFQEVLRGLTQAGQYGDLHGIAVDTWGVDFGLIGADGALLGLPIHYRDERTVGLAGQAFVTMSREAIYAATGVQPISFATLFQLLAARSSPAFTAAKRMLLMPDLMSYWLSGEIASERTIASTTCLTVPGAATWSETVLTRFDLDPALPPPLVPPGTAIGSLRPQLAETCGVSEIPVFAGASHDTAAAFAATTDAGAALAISSGTWSLAGIELPAPLVTATAERAGFSNETGVSGTIRFLRGLAGLWLVQECRRIWSRTGRARDFEELTDLAAAAPAFGSLIDPDDPVFLAPPEMPAAIATWCERTGQRVPDSDSAMLRCVLESLALAYRQVLEELERVIGRDLATIRITGGGARNRLLCQLTADATGRPVIAGPAEATAMGNALVQALADGSVGSLAEIRMIAERSSAMEQFEPAAEPGAWEDAYNRFLALKEVARA